MQLIFVDECGDAKAKDYLGICVASINHTHYKRLKAGFQKALSDAGWDPAIEFKGSHIFSAKKGAKNVTVEERIEIVRSALDLSGSGKNARVRFHYGSKSGVSDQRAEYLSTLPKLVKKALPRAPSGAGKDLLAISCDYRTDISKSDLRTALDPVISERGYTLLEQLSTPTSGYDTVGILFADIVGYLQARVETISNDSDLFEDTDLVKLMGSGKYRKLKTSKELIDRVKRLDVHSI